MRLPLDRIELSVIDSHTGGEPTRTVIGGAPDLAGATIAEQLEDLRSRFDWVRTALLDEPRGHPAMVGALLLPPVHPDAVARVIFFNNIGYLGMCGHGTIGVAATLAYLGKISPGEHLLETGVGNIRFHLHEDNRVSLFNVPSYRAQKNVAVDTPNFGRLTGDVAYGGNWFFLCGDHGLELRMDNLPQLYACTREIRAALEAAGQQGEQRGVIDHIELVGPPAHGDADAKNFVLCPGGEYDRSPCGTGTSAKLACLAADGRLAPGQRWVQESITGSLFEACYEVQGEKILPRIVGEAFITAEVKVVINPIDPLTFGLGFSR